MAPARISLQRVARSRRLAHHGAPLNAGAVVSTPAGTPRMIVRSPSLLADVF